MITLENYLINRLVKGILYEESKFIKSPLNYIGGKHRLLGNISKYIPKNINGRFIDLFGGGFNVGSNFTAKKIVYNDINNRVVDILKNWYETDIHVTLKKIDEFIDKYDLSKTNRVGYENMRNDYNKSNERDPIMLYTLTSYAYNNQMSFNKKR